MAEYVEAVVEEFGEEVDTDERLWPDYNSLSGLRADLTECITGRVGDWEIEQREKHQTEVQR